jgi:hypothetical protein
MNYGLIYWNKWHGKFCLLKAKLEMLMMTTIEF